MGIEIKIPVTLLKHNTARCIKMHYFQFLFLGAVTIISKRNKKKSKFLVFGNHIVHVQSYISEKKNIVLLWYFYLHINLLFCMCVISTCIYSSLALKRPFTLSRCNFNEIIALLSTALTSFSIFLLRQCFIIELRQMTIICDIICILNTWSTGSRKIDWARATASFADHPVRRSCKEVN